MVAVRTWLPGAVIDGGHDRQSRQRRRDSEQFVDVFGGCACRRLLGGRNPEPAQPHAASLRTDERMAAAQHSLAHAMQQAVVAEHGEDAVTANQTEPGPDLARRFELTEHMLMAREIGAPLVDIQVVGIAGLVDRVRLVNFSEQAGAGAETGLQIEVDGIEVRPAGQAELRADVLEVLNLDQKGKNVREMVNESLLTEIRDKIAEAGDDLRTNRLPRLPRWCSTCADCDLVGLCRNRQ